MKLYNLLCGAVFSAGLNFSSPVRANPSPFISVVQGQSVPLGAYLSLWANPSPSIGVVRGQGMPPGACFPLWANQPPSLGVVQGVSVGAYSSTDDIAINADSDYGDNSSDGLISLLASGALDPENLQDLKPHQRWFNKKNLFFIGLSGMDYGASNTGGTSSLGDLTPEELEERLRLPDALPPSYFPSLESLRTGDRYELIEKTEGRELYHDRNKNVVFHYNPLAHRIAYTNTQNITYIASEEGVILFSARPSVAYNDMRKSEEQLEARLQETFTQPNRTFAANALGCAGNWIVQEKRMTYAGISFVAVPFAFLGFRRLRRRLRR